VLPENTKPPELFVKVALPEMTFPVMTTPPVLPDTETDPPISLFCSETAPLLLVTDTLPSIVLPAQPDAPMVTGPFVFDTDNGPLTVAPQKVMARAPAELTDPLMLPALTYRAPPLATVTDPFTLPPFPIHTIWPFATVSELLYEVVIHGCVNPTEILVLAVTDE